VGRGRRGQAVQPLDDSLTGVLAQLRELAAALPDLLAELPGRGSDGAPTAARSA